METILEQIQMYWFIGTSVITIASAIVSITKTETDNKWLASILKYVMPVMDFLSMSTLGYAKKK